MLHLYLLKLESRKEFAYKQKRQLQVFKSRLLFERITNFKRITRKL